MDTSETSVNTEETQRLLTSIMSSASASTSNNMNINLGTKYEINNKILTTSLTTSVSKDTKGRKKYFFSSRASLHLSDKINGCDKNIEIREFISQVSKLYKVNINLTHFLSILILHFNQFILKLLHKIKNYTYNFYLKNIK